MLFTTVLFYVLSLILVIAAFRVVTARSPVTAVLHLILAFFTAAMVWMTTGAEFLSLLLVVVYVGAVMVMFLFVIMMLDVREESVPNKFKPYMPMSLIIGIVMVLEMGFVLTNTWYHAGPAAPVAADYNNTLAIGVLMYTDYVLAVLVGGIVLLVGMVSAIALTLRKRTDVIRTNSSQQVRVRAKDRLRMVNIASQTEQPAKADNTIPGDN
ncbi:NADH-quinone oxidoreductase subunit J [Alcaligenes endophyticus]|uniref:NADH-quinone oxidoreductase subunit J n=1 Tax=Alcaligenes endophyticus TaxID=1929088 RepID=A0ABT8EHT5_9BURK|nr:NADH-quinone oxidoreductase subunit J [Alcaligenes endophyticus]MCX5592120.1 NADH-quinone oxidoreductase subunit J [Alcaligenes endophyticus]MDN4120767.1 NADH-quinone oxidoreductase subunit J [Alcaligenes endophyticus]